MIRSFFAVAAVFAITSQASAAWLTQYGTIDFGGGLSVDLVRTLNSDTSVGLSFTNNISDATGGAVGESRRIVSVGGTIMGRVSHANGNAGPVLEYEGREVVAVYAIEGTAVTTVNSGGEFGANATFDKGRVAFYALDPDDPGFNSYDPSTWGAAGTPIAVYDLASPIAVGHGTLDGLPDPAPNFNVTAENMNQSSINSDVGTNSQGNFVFTQSQTYGGATLSDQFVTVTGPDYASTEHGLFARSDQSLDFATEPVTNDMITVLNAIAVNLGGLGGNPAGGFATGLGNAATDYNLNPDVTLSGDIRASLGLTFAPVAVPEPASIAMWTLFGAAALPIIRRRRRQQPAA